MHQICNSYHFLRRLSVEYGTRTVFTMRQGDMLYDVTYETFFHQVKAVSAELAVKTAGEKRIAVIAKNSYEWMLYFWGVMLLGKSAVLIDPELNQEEIENRLKSLNIRFVCIDEESSDLESLEKIPMVLPETSNFVSLDFWESDLEAQESMEAAILFSTGTTGDFKAVRLSQKNIVTAVIPNTAELVSTVFLPLPFYHSFTINSLISALNYGCRIYIGSGLRYVLKDLQRFQPEMVYVTPVYLSLFSRRLLMHVEEKGYLAKLFGDNLKFIVTGGAVPGKKDIEILRERGIRILSSYGSSETFCIASGELEGADNCVGQVATHIKVKIEQGEIWVKGSTVFIGYFEKENQMDNWYQTGDLGYVDDEGRLFLTGRKKNVILLSNGKNVSPEQLEAELYAISEVLEGMVYGKDNKICAELYLGDADSEETRNRVLEQIQIRNRNTPTYYQIHRIIFRDQPFVRTGIGKVRRNTKVCRDEAK